MVQKLKLVIMIVAIVMNLGQCLAQNEATEKAEFRRTHSFILFSKPINEEIIPFSIGIGYEKNELVSVDLTLHFPKGFKNFFIAGEFSKDYIGFYSGVKPLSLFTDNLYINTAIEWLYQVRILTFDTHPMSETFQNKGRMIFGLKIGPSFEVKRFGVGFYFSIGPKFVPGNVDQQDWQWNRSMKFYMHLKF